jgi:hypothetical protein
LASQCRDALVEPRAVPLLVEVRQSCRDLRIGRRSGFAVFVVFLVFLVFLVLGI